MKTILTTMFCFALTFGVSAQLGNKLSKKNLGLNNAVKPSNVKLKDVALPKNFAIKKAKKLKVPTDKLKLPARKKVKITPLRPYNPNLQLEFNGYYSKNYFITSYGTIFFNAQRGKEYRMKMLLADKKYLVEDLGSDFPNGDALIKIGLHGEWRSIPVNRTERELNIVFTAAQAGTIQIFLHGMVSPNLEWGDDWWLPLKSIQVDEI